MAYILDEKGKYKRTVTCGHCYESGHNKSSCKALRDSLRSRIAKNKDALEKDVWEYEWQKSTAENNLSHASRALHRLESKGKSRKCGYCKNEGHSRPTCTERKEHTEAHTEKTLKFRRDLCDKFIEHGLAPGALVNVDVSEWTGNNTDIAMAIVTSVDFSKVRESCKYDGTRYLKSSIRMINATLVKPVKSSWHSSMISQISISPNVQLLNTDNLEVDKEFRNSTTTMDSVASAVDASTEMMSFGSSDRKTVSKWVLNNIVDPK